MKDLEEAGENIQIPHKNGRDQDVRETLSRQPNDDDHLNCGEGGSVNLVYDKGDRYLEGSEIRKVGSDANFNRGDDCSDWNELKEVSSWGNNEQMGEGGSKAYCRLTVRTRPRWQQAKDWRLIL